MEKREPILRASTGHLSEHALSVPVTYFLKMTTAGKGISPEQIEADVEFGVLPSGPSHEFIRAGRRRPSNSIYHVELCVNFKA